LLLARKGMRFRRMLDRSDFDELLRSAFLHPIQGWDFSWLREEGRYQEDPLPWVYSELVARRARRSPDLLDLGTGGGERLAAITPHPQLTVATESYPPNVGIAARRLAPFGIDVVHVSSIPDNAGQGDVGLKGSLPFRDSSFHLVIDRNEAFVARDVARVLAPGGVFLTEQSGGSVTPEIYRLLGVEPPASRAPDWNLDLARKQLVAAGLHPFGSGEADFSMSFSDVGALAWYLTAVPWTFPGFSVERQRRRLERLHSRVLDQGPIRVPRYAFWLEAGKG